VLHGRWAGGWNDKSIAQKAGGVPQLHAPGFIAPQHRKLNDKQREAI
jgi:hypothetical protein